VELMVADDGTPSLFLRDEAGNMRAALGVRSLEDLKTGEMQIRPESSLVLFDKDGKTIWQAP
jgi:hypothetical protein